MDLLIPTEAGVVQSNARDWLGLTRHDDDYLADESEYASQDASAEQYGDETPGDQLAEGSSARTVIVRLQNFRDAATVGEYFRQEIPVIINLEDLDTADATRIIDFVAGLIIGLRGDLERISRRAFLITPAGATIIRA
jgi:cell division inhibitor SepF